MDQNKWLRKHCASLEGKTVAVTGATGDLGREICRAVLALSGDLILLNRDPRKTQALRSALLQEFPGREIRFLPLELTDLSSVDRACRDLEQLEPQILVHNAGAYSIPRKTCDTGLDNVFQINFAAPYYMTRKLLPMLSRIRGKVVVMGSVAHTYSRSDPEDMDFSTRQKCHLVYGNSKRYLMFAFRKLMDRHPEVDFAIAHPGISFTNISAHYPPLVFALIRLPMKVIFPKPAKAIRSMAYALTHRIPTGCWVGPGLFGIWGGPAVRQLRTCSEQEQISIYSASESWYRSLEGGSSVLNNCE